MKKWMLSICALVLCAALLLSYTGTADAAIDFDKELTIKVNVSGDKAISDDLTDNTSVAIDLYKIASAEKVSDFDTYIFTADSLFTDLQADIDDPDINNDKWNSIAQKAADIVLRSRAANDPALTVTQGNAGAEMSIGKNPGLYLIVARGSDIGQDKPASGNYPRYAEVNSSGKIVTIANTDNYKYSFEPVLVAAPGKEADEDGVINTANTPDEWIYDLDVTLKPERLQNDGQLRIVKTFESFEVDHTVTSVFSLTAYSTYEGAGSSSNVEVPGFEKKYYSIVSSDENGGSVTIDNIPYGSTVVVTEEYAGHAYTFVSKSPADPIVIGDEISEVIFTNKYDNSNRHGGSVTNSFKYDDTAGTWTLNGTTNKNSSKSWK